MKERISYESLKTIAIAGITFLLVSLGDVRAQTSPETAEN
jgi:hypothetical protein